MRNNFELLNKLEKSLRRRWSDLLRD